MRSVLGEKLHVGQLIEGAFGTRRPVCYVDHHISHAASAFYPSPFASAAILTIDGVGEHATLTIGHGRDKKVELLREIRYPHSLGLLYSAITQYCGFRVNSGEYKLMGLAPYGEPRFADLIRKHLIDIKEDGSFALDLDYFAFMDGAAMSGTSTGYRPSSRGLSIDPTGGTPDFFYFKRPHLGATAWAALAETGWNPFTGGKVP